MIVCARKRSCQRFACPFDVCVRVRVRVRVHGFAHICALYLWAFFESKRCDRISQDVCVYFKRITVHACVSVCTSVSVGGRQGWVVGGHILGYL